MTTVTVGRPFGDAPTAGIADPWDIVLDVVERFDDIEADWRALETNAVMAPYGRFDWIAAYRRSLPDEGRHIRVAILRRVDGELVALMPFQVEHRFGLKIAAALGKKHANYNLPVMSVDFAAGLTADAARQLLLRAGRAIGADLIAVPNVPAVWNGWPNAFAAGGRPGASDAWALRLGPDGEAVLARSMSGDARKKMRNKARGLAKAGSVRMLRATSPEEVTSLLDAFFHQKARRFGELGVTDPFADPTVRRFLHEGSTARLGEGDPPIELYALLVDDHPVAVIGGASDGRRFSGMIVSFQAGPLDRFSPGEMLVTEVIKDLCRRGFDWFDLGVGDARYKRSICDEMERLVDVQVPLTLGGRTASLARAALISTKRRVKENPRAMVLVKRVRKIASSLRG